MGEVTPLPSHELLVQDWEWHEDKDPPFHKAGVNTALQKYSHLLFPNGEPCKVFVPLCGKSVDMIYLADLGHEVVGLEYSEIGVNAFFKENNLSFIKKELGNAPFVEYKANEKKITIYRGDLFEMSVDICGKFDAIWDRGSYVAINVPQRMGYTDLMFTLMKPTCRCLLEAFFYDSSKYAGPPHYVTAEHLKETFGRCCAFELLGSQVMPKIPPTAPPGTKFDVISYLITMKKDS